jgi:hypothetical protein
MDFTKFYWMIAKRALFFTRLKYLEDKYEGVQTEISYESWRRTVERQVNAGQRGPSMKIEMDRINHIINVNKGHAATCKDNVCVNCWHCNEYESTAMWRLYLLSNEGVAIKSTADKLITSLPLDKTKFGQGIIGGVVDYIDYATQPMEDINYRHPFMYKRISFKHENEYRVCLLGYGNPWIDTAKVETTDRGVIVPVAIDRLVDDVYVAPNASPLLTDVVADVLKTHGIAKPPIHSALTDTV